MITLSINDAVFYSDVFLSHMPDGQPHITLDKLWNFNYFTDVTINWHYESMAEFVDIAVLKDALFNKFDEVSLFVPYFPGARQDRQESGGALTVAVIGKLINSLKFSNVVIVDPHSDVTPAVVANSTVVPLEDIFDFDILHGKVLVCPDYGARKRVEAIAKVCGCPIIYMDKKRDPVTGKLSGFNIISGEEHLETSNHLLVIDDICDGGGTFIGLANALSEAVQFRFYRPIQLDLFVTHGLFTKGIRPLISAGYDHIYTTNSVPQQKEEEGLLTVIDLN